MKYDQYMKTIGKNISERREAAGLTVNRAAQLSLIKWAQFRDIEAGIANPTTKTFQKIADALSVDIDELLDVKAKKRKK